MENRFRELCVHYGLPSDLTIVAFPDFLTPGATADVPQITENCMTTYHTEETRRAMGDLVLDNLAAHFAGRPALTPLA